MLSHETLAIQPEIARARLGMAPIGIAACAFAVRINRNVREGQAYFIDRTLLIFLLALGVAVMRLALYWPRPPD